MSSNTIFSAINSCLEYLNDKEMVLHFIGIRRKDSNNVREEKSVNEIPHSSMMICVHPTLYTIKDLKDKVRQEYTIPKESCLLFISDKLMLKDNEKSLEYYGIGNESVVLSSVSETNWAIEKEPEKYDFQVAEILTARERIRRRNELMMEKMKSRFVDKRNIRTGMIKVEIKKPVCAMKVSDHVKELPKEIEKRLKYNEDIKEFVVEEVKDLDITTFEMDDHCIKMECLHGFTKDSLLLYCKSIFEKGENTIKCPRIIDDKSNQCCDKELNFGIVKKILQNEKKEEFLNLSLKGSKNTLKDCYNIQQCNKCKSILYREKLNLVDIECYTHCPLCFNSFCWACRGEDFDTNKSICQDKKCSLAYIKQNIKLLTEARLKSIGPARNVPAIRACPKCCQIIEHHSACKHMECFYCHCRFCFVCLKLKDVKRDKWQCGSYSAVCPVHPVQKITSLPVPDPIVKLF